MIGVKGRVPEVSQVLRVMDQLQSEPLRAYALLYALGDGLRHTGSSLALADPEGLGQPFYAQALSFVQYYSAAEPLRVSAMQLLGVGPFTFASAGDLLLLQLGSGQPEAVQSTALATLGRFDDPRVAPALVQRWRILTPRLRSDAFGVLLAHTNRLATVLGALETRVVDGANLSLPQVNVLRTYRDPAIRQRALHLFGPVPRQRPEAVQRFRPALGLKGLPARGREVFLARCAACHQPSGATPSFGPHLNVIQPYGKERILSAILAPNAEPRRTYLTYEAETSEGELFIGLLRDHNPAAITLQPLYREPVVLPRSNLEYLEAQPWSLMPQGLEEGLTPQNMANLLEYISTSSALPRSALR